MYAGYNFLGLKQRIFCNKHKLEMMASSSAKISEIITTILCNIEKDYMLLNMDIINVKNAVIKYIKNVLILIVKYICVNFVIMQ